jgi:hypothetical protein
MMNAAALDQVCHKVYQKFPALRGSQPQMQPYADGLFLLIFNGTAKTADGRSLNQTVRVVAGADGSIKKMTASR